MSESGDPFDTGPFTWVRHPLPLAPACRPKAGRRALATALIAWAPLVVLSAVDGLVVRSAPHESVLLDAAALARYLVAAPTFVYAGAVVLPQLANVVREFRDADLVAEADAARFDSLIASTRRLLLSRWTDAALVLLAYVATFATSPLLYPSTISTWVAPSGGSVSGRISLAGWWRLLVSQPLFLALLGTWLCRLLLWIRFLRRARQFDLRLVAAHPDRLGGLGFVLIPLRGFALLAFALGAIAAGSVAENVLVDGQPLGAFQHLIGAQVLLVLTVTAGPMLLLTGPLIRLRAWGTFHYGELASHAGHAFEQRWLRHAGHANNDMLAAPDFSATTDLYAIVANVNAINPFVLDLRALIILTVATLLPYVPLVLAVMPLNEILQFALKALT